MNFVKKNCEKSFNVKRTVLTQSLTHKFILKTSKHIAGLARCRTPHTLTLPSTTSFSFRQQPSPLSASCQLKQGENHQIWLSLGPGCWEMFNSKLGRGWGCWFVVFADFCGVDTTTMATFKLLMSHHWTEKQHGTKTRWPASEWYNNPMRQWHNSHSIGCVLWVICSIICGDLYPSNHILSSSLPCGRRYQLWLQAISNALS